MHDLYKYHLLLGFFDKYNALVSTQQETKHADVDYHKVLEVPINATQSEIRTAYLRLVKIWHPIKIQIQQQENDLKKLRKLIRFSS